MKIIKLHLRDFSWIAEVDGKEYILTANKTRLPRDTPIDALGKEINKRYPGAEIWLGREISKNPFYQKHLDQAEFFHLAPLLDVVQKMLDNPEVKECYQCQSDAYMNPDHGHWECVECGYKEILNSTRHFNIKAKR